MNAELDAGRAAAPRPAKLFRAGLGRKLPWGYLRVSPLTRIPDILGRFGCDAALLMDQAGVPAEAFSHPDNALPFKTVCRFLSSCAEASGREDFGLLAAEGASPSTLGLVGFLMKQADDLRAALGDLVSYFHHHDGGAAPFVNVRGGVVEFGYAVMEVSEPGVEIVYDGAVAIGCQILKTLCGPRWKPLEITLSRREPAAPQRYSRHFGAPVTFDTERSALLFSESWLDTPIPAADPALRNMLREQIEALEAEGDGNLTEKVRRIMRGAAMFEGGVVEDVAALLQMSKRALQRKLEGEGSGYRKLWDEIRFEFARQLLEGTRLPITQIALALHFSEASAFSRAFRAWSGLPPSEWRSRRAGAD